MITRIGMFPCLVVAKMNKKIQIASFLSNFVKYYEGTRLLMNVDTLDPNDFIIIKGARVNNLKNISLAIPRNQFVVITGLSG